MTNKDPKAFFQKKELREQLDRGIRTENLFHGRPTERLAAIIAVQLINQDRHTPWSLCFTIDCIDELRRRLASAKV